MTNELHNRRATDGLGRELTRRASDLTEKSWAVMIKKPHGSSKMTKLMTYPDALTKYQKTLGECKFGYRVLMIKVVSDEISMTGTDGKV